MHFSAVRPATHLIFLYYDNITPPDHPTSMRRRFSYTPTPSTTASTYASSGTGGPNGGRTAKAITTYTDSSPRPMPTRWMTLASHNDHLQADGHLCGQATPPATTTRRHRRRKPQGSLELMSCSNFIFYYDDYEPTPMTTTGRTGVGPAGAVPRPKRPNFFKPPCAVHYLL